MPLPLVPQVQFSIWRLKLKIYEDLGHVTAGKGSPWLSSYQAIHPWDSGAFRVEETSNIFSLLLELFPKGDKCSLFASKMLLMGLKELKLTSLLKSLRMRKRRNHSLPQAEDRVPKKSVILVPKSFVHLLSIFPSSFHRREEKTHPFFSSFSLSQVPWGGERVEGMMMREKILGPNHHQRG